MAASAQVTLYGSLSNFDVVNDTGQDVHGMEIEFHGASNIYSYYNWNRYGAPTVVPFPDNSGVWVRWMSAYNTATGTWVTGTPQAVHPTAMTGHQCIQGTLGYETSGCEHFGISVLGNATQTIYRWLIADPANPGQLIPMAGRVSIPAPVWSVEPPAQPADPFVVVAVVDPPQPPEPAKRFGEAQWMKTYKTENQRQVLLDELVADNAVVPEDEAHVETAWELLQSDIADPGGKQKRHRGRLGNGNRAVVRRFELYKFAGNYDPVTNQAICLDGTCTAPADSELGDFIGAQNAAGNLNVPDFYPLTITVKGDGQVTDANRLIKCSGTCSTSVKTGDTVMLTAKGAKGVFSGWSGACNGVSPTCSVTVSSDSPVTATFKTPYKLVIKTVGTGTVSASPSASSYLEGSSVTVTAVPGAGATWKGWTGAGCSGLSLSCTVVINADTTVTATFK